MGNYKVIGAILENGEIERDESPQGLIYKNPNAFMAKSGVCYVSEIHDSKYSYNDFLEIANGNEELAKELFWAVDWQSPETKMEEWYDSDEAHCCESCKKTFFSYEVDNCPYCGTVKSI